MDELFDLPLAQAPVVVLDTETTGLNPITGDRIVEIAALRFGPSSTGPWQKQAEFNQLIQPGRRMDPAASRVNRIYDRDLAGKPRFSQVASDLLAFIDNALVVAHNARFDAGFLGMEFYASSKQGLVANTSELNNPWLCTLLLARRHFYFGRNNLSHIARTMGIRSGRAHRALNDVHMTAEVLKRMARELADMRLITVGDLLLAQGGAIYAEKPANATLPSPMAEAISEKRSLRIQYAGLGGRSEHLIDPLYSTSSGDREYLIAFCRRSNDQRTFRLDRILSAELVKE